VHRRLDRGPAPAPQLELPVAERRGEASVGAAEQDTPGGEERLMAQVVERGNLLAALRRVKRNGGSPGTDGMTVEELPGSLREHWPRRCEALRAGTYRPSPVKRVEIPKPGGGVRKLGIPTVLDRFVQQAVRQVRQPRWEPTFSEGRDGFRPGRSAHQAVAHAQHDVREGHSWVVDRDLEKFFDRVNQDTLMSLVKERVADRRVRRRIDRSLKAGALTDEGLEATGEGPPPGGPWSPLLAHLLLDELDQEVARRGQRFVRDADDGTIFVKSARAGQRVVARVTRCLARRLKLAVNAAKSAVARPWQRTLLGFTCTGHRPNRRRVSEKALEACKHEVRKLTSRTRGVSLGRVVGDRRRDLDGWYAYFGVTEAPSSVKALDSWVRRRRRGYLWQQWGRRRYRERRRRGVSRELAWNTGTSAQGPWRISRRPARAIALPGRAFDARGLPRLHRSSPR
jgi:RNA-directed DNA polymerase